jgi:hypothetical protein
VPALTALLPTLLAIVVFALYFQAQPHWLADPDAQDYAQLGRQIVAGRGPTSRYMPLNGLAFLAQRNPAHPAVDPWPNITRFPLTPALMALGFGAFGANDEAVHLPGGLAFVLTAACAGWLGGRAYGPWAGLAAGLTAAFLPLLVNYSLTGLTEPLLGALLLATLASVVAGRLALGGLLLGLAILNRYDTALLALPILGLWLLPRPDRWRAGVRLLAPAAIVVLPWTLYLTVVAGTPLFNLQPASIAAQASGRSDGLGWYLPEYVPPGDVWTRNPAAALRTAWDEVSGTPNYLRKLLGWSWLAAGAAACLLSLVRERGRGDASRLTVFLLVAILLRAGLASTLGLNLQRHFVPLVPLLLVIVAGEAIWLVQAVLGRLPIGTGTRRLARLAGEVTVVGLMALPGLWTIAPFLMPPVQPLGPPTRTGEVEAHPEYLARLAEIVGPDQLVASNVPWSVAWQGDRRAIPLPPTVEETVSLERRFGLAVDAIYLAGQVAIADAPRSWRGWDELRRRGVAPPGYTLAESFPNGGRLYLKAP